MVQQHFAILPGKCQKRWEGARRVKGARTQPAPAHQPVRQPAHQLAALDGLRGLAILLVLCGHLYTIPLAFHLVQPTFPLSLAGFGFAGVMLFFALSGFLLFLPYARALLAGQAWPSARHFYLRRVLRILPLYLVVLAFILRSMHPQMLQASLGPLALAPALFYDFRPDSFLLITTPVPPLWTLTIEWQFYLLLPWLALALAKLMDRRAGSASCRRLIIGLAGLILIGLSIRGVAALAHYAWGLASPLNAPGPLAALFAILYGMKGKYLECFALGIAASLLYVWAAEHAALTSQARQRVGRLLCLGAVLGLMGCLLWAIGANRIAPAAFTAQWWLFPESPTWYLLGDWALTCCFAALLLGALLSGGMAPRLFSLAPLPYLGKISYSVYLWHWSILLLLIPAFTSYPQFVLASLVIILAFCSLSYYLIERPFLRLRRFARDTQRAPAAPANTPALAQAPEQADLAPVSPPGIGA